MKLTFRVSGLPVAKGSLRAFLPKGTTRPILTSTSRNLKSWEQNIHSTAVAAARLANWSVPDRAIPIGVSVSVALPRPKSLTKNQIDHVKKPDLDKLIRAVLDALTGIGYEDDSQVMLIDATKRYVVSGEMAGIVVCVQVFA